MVTEHSSAQTSFLVSGVYERAEVHFVAFQARRPLCALQVTEAIEGLWDCLLMRASTAADAPGTCLQGNHAGMQFLIHHHSYKI